MKTIYVSENTGTGSPSYAIVHKDAMGAEPWVPKAELDKVLAKLKQAEAKLAAIAKETKT